jgi:AraC-like DNA-binding protein
LRPQASRGDLRIVREDDLDTSKPTAEASEAAIWTPAKEFDDFARVCCGQPHLRLLADPDGFSVNQRVGQIGPVALSEIAVGSDLPMDGGQVCGSYRVIVVRAGRTEAEHRGHSVVAGPGCAAVFTPEGLGTGQWDAGSRLICLKIQRSAIDDALSNALGRQVTSQVDFTPVLPVDAAATRSWINMLVAFKEQYFRTGSLLNQPLVGLPFVDGLVRGFLLAADHPHLDALTRDERLAAPRAIRTAVDLIEEEAHLPLTLSSIAARCHVSVRTLQQGFQRYLDTSPMAYLREVRLRRAHEALLETDPSMTTVASIAYRWGFSNLGRFAAAHAARYRETPTETLRRKAFHHGATELSIRARTA